MLQKAAMLEAEEKNKVQNLLRMSSPEPEPQNEEVVHMENVCSMFKILDKRQLFKQTALYIEALKRNPRNVKLTFDNFESSNESTIRKVMNVEIMTPDNDTI